MADTVALEAQLTALREAYYSGATRVAYGDKSVEYRSRADMLATISGLEQQLGISSARPGAVVVRARKGW